MQSILSGRFEKKHRKVKHDFAFSGLITCGHCGCSLVGDIKKARHTYYRCSGYKGDWVASSSSGLDFSWGCS